MLILCHFEFRLWLKPDAILERGKRPVDTAIDPPGPKSPRAALIYSASDRLVYAVACRGRAVARTDRHVDRRRRAADANDRDCNSNRRHVAFRDRDEITSLRAMITLGRRLITLVLRRITRARVSNRFERDGNRIL